MSGAAHGYPRDATVPALFAEQVARAPEAVALERGDERLTYAALDRRAGRLARRLIAAGVGPEVPVALCLPRAFDLVVAALAVLKAGGAYVPLEPGFPAERLRFFLADTGAPVLVTAETLRGRFREARAHVLLIEPIDRAPGDEPAILPPLPPRAISPESLAYVLYTSGSTGVPKGVAVTHRAIVRLVRGTDFAQLGAEDRVAQVSNVGFDAATFEIWGALLNGGRLVGIDREALLSPAAFAGRLCDLAVSTLFLTTALFNQMVREAPQAFGRLRHMLFGGEAADPALVRAALAAHSPRRLLHVYGPTENTTFSTWLHLTEVAQGAASVPIGGAIAHGHVHLLDPEMAPVPAGVPGEIFVGGDGLARGYFARPDLTAERFVPARAELGVGEPGERLYRTGDLARRLPDGSLDFLGRIDGQVKIRGFRIELGEIEAALRRHPAVADAAVVVREETPGDRRLIAFYVAAAGPADPAALRAFLRQDLPDYMLPAALVPTAALPLTANGKVDRRALAALMRLEASAGAAYVAPRTPVEEVVADVWAEVLRVERAGVDDDFFALGGDSPTRLAARLAATFQVELPLPRLFAAPTVAGMAAAIAGHETKAGQSERIARALLRLKAAAVERRTATAGAPAGKGNG